jgi:hypothetical protein
LGLCYIEKASHIIKAKNNAKNLTADVVWLKKFDGK